MNNFYFLIKHNEAKKNAVALKLTQCSIMYLK